MAVVSLLAYLSHLESLNIGNFEVSGHRVIDVEELETAAREQLAGKYLFIFPKSNILYYTKNSLEDGLKDKFKRIKEISFSIKDKRTLQISLTEREPKYTWCGVELPLSDANDSAHTCYFMDDTGYIFDKAPYFSGEVYFKFYGMPQVSDVGRPTSDGDFDPLGSHFFGQNFGQFILFRDVLVNMGMKPKSLYVNKDKDVEIHLSRGQSVAEEPKIILKTDTDFKNAAENLDAAMDTEPLKTDFQKKYQTLQYIDLRFGNKVYYRF